MQGNWGWDRGEPHVSDSTTKHWQGQWETYDHCETSGQWEGAGGNWDQLSNDESIRYEEFENVMRWDDSGALEAFKIAQGRHEACSRGLTYPFFLPSPDLYIQTIDWDSHEDLELPESGDTFSQHGERTGQRKRGRKGGGFKGDKRGNKQFERQDYADAFDRRQSNQPFSQSAYHGKLQAQSGWDQTMYHGSSNAPSLDGPVYSSQRDGRFPPLQSPWQGQMRSNWVPQWNSRSQQSQHRWQQPNVSSEQGRGWVHGKGLHQSSHGLLNDLHRHQAGPTTSANGQGLPYQLMPQSNRGPGHLHQAPVYVPDKTCKWKQQQSKHQWHHDG